MLAEVGGSKIFPYRNKEDVIRHAIDRHLKWLETLAPVPSVTKQVDAVMAVLREEEFNQDFLLLFNKLQAQISSYMGIGAERDAVALLARVKQYIDDMPSGVNWKKRYQTKLEDQFGHMLKGTRGVSLQPSDAESRGDG